MIKKRSRRAVSYVALACACMTLISSMATIAVTSPVAHAVPSMSDYQQKVNNQKKLKQQLAGVNQQLAQSVLRLNELTEQKIPAAEKSVQDAQSAAQQAQSAAQATQERLKAAQKDKSRLEEEIRQTGINFDDAKAAVAQLARESFHGSDTSKIIQVVTRATTTQDFVNKLQADVAIARSEANAANDAAVTLNNSMNRRDRLAAIEKRISDLKTQADNQVTAATQAASQAEAKQKELVALREQESHSRQQLESQKNSLSSSAAKEAVEIVAMKAEIDAYNLKLAQLRSRPNPHTDGRQQLRRPMPSAPARRPVAPPPAAPSGPAPQGMNYNPFGNCYEGMTTCYGHPTGNIPSIRGNAYPWSECTWYAYHRRVDYYHLPTGSFMGNGGQWAATGRRLGYLVNHTPHVGAAIVFLPGQDGSDPRYGHVGVVERINADGSILISECGAVWRGVPHWRTIRNPGAYQYVHY